MLIQKGMSVVIIFLFIGTCILPSSVAQNSNEKSSLLILDGNHAPIRIIGNDQFTEENGVTGGSGTEDDPYIIENWTIVSDGSTSEGIFINNTNAYFIIRNCTIQGFNHPDKFYQGIEFSVVTHGRIEDTKVSESAIGIYIRYSTENEMENCTFSDCPVYPDGYGIGIFRSMNTTIVCCKCYNMRYGISVSESSGISLQKTESYNNTDYGLISLDEPSLHFLIEDCIFSNNGYDGIALSGASSPYPSGSIIRNSSFNSNSDCGVWIQRLWNTTIENCVFNHNGHGLSIGDRVKNIIIRNCSFLYNVADGLQVSGEFLFLTFAPNTEISYCDFIENECGLFLFATRGTRVHHCRFINNSFFGILSAFSSPRITLNSFFNNGREFPENGSCGAFIWASFTDLRNNYWGNSEGPSISFIVRSTNHTAKLVPIRTIDDSDTILFQGVFGRCVSRFRPWLSEPVPDVGRQT